jgi:hypothetical protein
MGRSPTSMFRTCGDQLRRKPHPAVIPEGKYFANVLSGAVVKPDISPQIEK